MKQKLHYSLRLTATLLVALCASSAWGESSPIELTFPGRGESTSVESVTVTNLTHPEIAPVTLSGTDILCLADEETIKQIALMCKQTGTDIHHIGDSGHPGIAAPKNIMAYSISIRGIRHTYHRMAASVRR